jgi:hypothetical protein
MASAIRGYNAPIENDKRAIGRSDSLLPKRVLPTYSQSKPLAAEQSFPASPASRGELCLGLQIGTKPFNQRTFRLSLTADFKPTGPVIPSLTPSHLRIVRNTDMASMDGR